MKTHLLTLFILFIAAKAIAGESDFEYLKPSDVSGLPFAIIAELETEKCLIPKWKYQFGGVTRGEFAAIGQIDTAVICVHDNKAEIRIFWGGPEKCGDRIQSFGEFISTVDKDYILDHYQAYGGPEPPKITHQAINDHVVEKASVVKYCHNGKWVELTGAD